MPNQSLSNIIGRKGERWFQSQIPSDWIFQAPSEDIGIDGTVVICDESPLNGTEFRVQIKASEKFSRDTEQLTVPKIKRSTFVYWLSGFTPTLLVAYDHINDEGYYYWVNKLVAENSYLQNTESEMINLSIPKLFKINSECWTNIKDDLKDLKISIANMFHDQSILLPYLYDLMQIIKRLNYSNTVKKIDGSPLTPEDIKFIWEVEISCHREFVLIVEEILTHIKEESSTGLYIKRVISGYKKVCEGFCVNFEEALYNWTADFEIGVKPKIMEAERHNTMGMMINLVNSFLIPFKKEKRLTNEQNKQ
jgi:Domain of unknown function (DUF4365)